jgi:acyl-CoA thioester hydrolase
MQTYHRRFRVRHSELNVLGQVSPAGYLHYMQEAAIEASAAAGFGLEWYQAQGTGWVVRRLTARYLQPLTYGQEVEVVTWVSSLRGARSHREYDLVRCTDGVRVARGRAEWIYVERATGRPMRFAVEEGSAMTPQGRVPQLNVHPIRTTPTTGAYRYVSRRRAQLHELDTAQHVNHIMYLHWVDQAYCDAVRLAGHSFERMRAAGWMTIQAAHDIHYFASAEDNDPIEIVSWLGERAPVRGGWTHEMYHADSRKLLVRAYSLAAAVNLQGRPCKPPPCVMEEVLRGPAQDG